MGQHELFLSRLIALVEYAEENQLNVAAEALTAAAEIVAPTLRDEVAASATSPISRGSAKVFRMSDFRASEGAHR